MTGTNALRNLLTVISKEHETKTAAAKKAFDGVDSSHPTAKVDDGTQPNKEGPRIGEHAKDLKEVPGPDNVQTVAEAKEDEQNAQQFNVGLTSKAVGTDPATERDFKTKQEDPGTTHPAKAGKEATFADLRASADTAANKLLAKLAAARGPQAAAAQPAAAAAAPAAPVASDAQKAAAAGYADASKAIAEAGPTDDDLQKLAQTIVGRGTLMGRLVIQHLQKLAAEEEKESGGEGGEGGGENKEKAAPPAEAGGSPPVTDNPAGLMGAMQGGGGGGEADQMSELMSLLAESGMSLDDLIGALQAQVGGGGGAGGPPGMGGPPPGAGAPPAMPPGAPDMGGGAPPPPDVKMAQIRLLSFARRTKVAASQGLLRVREAKTAGEIQTRNQVRQSIRDLINPHR